MKKLLIHNYCRWHYEIIESVIIKYNEFFNIPCDETIEIYLYFEGNASFKSYIENKYPNIIFNNISDYDYSINCTIYDSHYDNLNQNINSNEKYIAHEITDRLKSNPNVYFLTTLAKNNIFTANILPYYNIKIKTKIPIYLIQGDINRRYIELLKKILDTPLFYKYKIKILGKYGLPKEFNKYKKRIIVKSNLSFIDYHKELSNVYCILPLISKEKHPQYYTRKLTSSINYSTGYNLKCLIDSDLQNIYNLNNVVIYDDINDISEKFKKTLKKFYNNPTLNKKILSLNKIYNLYTKDINFLKKNKNKKNKLKNKRHSTSKLIKYNKLKNKIANNQVNIKNNKLKIEIITKNNKYINI